MRLKKNLPTVKRESVEEQVYAILRSAILNARFRGGARLIQENLALELGTSRMPVRDALKRLVADGLVAVDEQGGYRVTTFGQDDARQLYELRALLEEHAAVAALDRMTPKRKAELASIVGSMEAAASAGDNEAYTKLNTHFHMLLYETSGRALLLRTIESLWLGRSPLTPISVTGQLDRSRLEHRKILEAIDADDAEMLRAAIKRHITTARDALLDYLQEEEAQDALGGELDRRAQSI